MDTPLRYWLETLGLPLEPSFAAYGQAMQSLVDPASGFAGNATGANVLLVRISDVAGQDTGSNVDLLIDAWRGFASRTARPLVVVVTPSGGGWREHEQRLIEAVDAVDGVAVAARYGVDEVFDATAEKLGRVPYTSGYFAALATGVARRLHRYYRDPFKVIAVDCDNTLWSGVCGEDGPEGVVVDEPRLALQRMLIERREAGMVLAIASKNNEADVWETFAAHPEMLVRREDFAAWRINWKPKSGNLCELSRQLNVGLDSVVFLDDSGTEIAEVAGRYPQVAGLRLPDRDEELAAWTEHLWPLDHGRLTREDALRAASYAQQGAREAVAKSAGTLEEFLASLQLKLTIGEAQAEQMARVGQLIQRTNQMNTTTLRLSEAEVEARLASGEYECLVAEASDRFGEYGLIGVTLVKKAAETWTIESLLLSCRAFGREIESRLVEAVAGRARAAGARGVELPLIKTAKNAPAVEFLESLSDAVKIDVEGAEVYRLSVEAARTLRRREVASEEVAPAAAPAENGRFQAYSWIAREMRTASQIEAAVAAWKRTLRVSGAAAPVGELEQGIARIWCDVLHVSEVGRDENFFDLGGHSLLAVQLLARMKEELGVDLSLEVIYQSSLTVAELAQAVELAQLGTLDPEEYAALLAEVEGLSDDEVRALLEAEEAGDAK